MRRRGVGERAYVRASGERPTMRREERDADVLMEERAQGCPGRPP